MESDPKMALDLLQTRWWWRSPSPFGCPGARGSGSGHSHSGVGAPFGWAGRGPFGGVGVFDASQKRRLDQRLRTISVEGTAVLGSTSITLGELQSMAVGDVLDLDQEQPSFTVGGGAPGRCMWAIGEIAESFALVRPHKHQISMIFGRMVPSSPDGLGSICIGSSPPCANGVLTFDPSAMPAEPGWDCRRSLASAAGRGSNDLIPRVSSVVIPAGVCCCDVWHGATPLVQGHSDRVVCFAWHVIPSICIVP